MGNPRDPCRLHKTGRDQQVLKRDPSRVSVRQPFALGYLWDASNTRPLPLSGFDASDVGVFASSNAQITVLKGVPKLPNEITLRDVS